MQYINWNIDRLDELVNLWNQELGESFPMRKELFEQNSFKDENVCHEGSCMAVDSENNVVGFVVAKRRQDNVEVSMNEDDGWIQALLVDSNYHNIGIGSELLRRVESQFKANGKNHIWLGKDTSHYFPGIPTQYENTTKWFEKHGYKNDGKEFDLICHYNKSNTFSFPLKSDVELSLLNKEEQEHFISFLHQSFPGRWEYEAIQYFQKAGTGREFVVLKKKGKIIGFCRINDSNSPVIAQNVYWAPLFNEELGGIGPLGIDSNERKNGYGLFIVEAAIAYLRERNIDSIVIDWTGLIDFYDKLGYKLWKSYYTYKKSI